MKRTCEIEAPAAVRMDHPLVLAYQEAVEIFHAVVPLTKCDFKKTTGNLYSYEFTAVDGRAWQQVLDFNNGLASEPQMNWSVATFWKLSEFQFHRRVRDALAAIVKEFAVTKIETKW